MTLCPCRHSLALGNMEPDDWRWHMYDTVKGSDWLGDQVQSSPLIVSSDLMAMAHWFKLVRNRMEGYLANIVTYLINFHWKNPRSRSES